MGINNIEYSDTTNATIDKLLDKLDKASKFECWTINNWDVHLKIIIETESLVNELVFDTLWINDNGDDVSPELIWSIYKKIINNYYNIHLKIKNKKVSLGCKLIMLVDSFNKIFRKKK